MDALQLSLRAAWPDVLPALPAVSDQVCVPVWAVGLTICFILALAVFIGASKLRVKNLHSQLDQSTEDTGTLSELFSSELQRMRLQLSRSREDSESLDEIVEQILKDGLPGFLELVSKDYWCVKIMEVKFTDSAGERRSTRQTGYDISCFVPGGATDIEVTFGVVGGSPCMAVDRSKPGCPWIYEDDGSARLETFTYRGSPGHVKFEVSGHSLGIFVSNVVEGVQIADAGAKNKQLAAKAMKG